MSTSYIPYSFGSESYRAKVRCSYLDGMSSTKYKDSDAFTFGKKEKKTTISASYSIVGELIQPEWQYDRVGTTIKTLSGPVSYTYIAASTTTSSGKTNTVMTSYTGYVLTDAYGAESYTDTVITASRASDITSRTNSWVTESRAIYYVDTDVSNTTWTFIANGSSYEYEGSTMKSGNDMLYTVVNRSTSNNGNQIQKTTYYYTVRSKTKLI